MNGRSFGRERFLVTRLARDPRTPIRYSLDRAEWLLMMMTMINRDFCSVPKRLWIPKCRSGVEVEVVVVDDNQRHQSVYVLN